MAGKGIKQVDTSLWPVYRQRAEHFLRAVSYLVDDVNEFKDALGSAAVHSAISFTDAVLVMETGTRGTDQHERARQELAKLVKAQRLAEAGLKDLKWLLARKHTFEYSERHAPVAEAKLAVERSRRFAHWVYNAFPALAGQGSTT